MWRARTTETHLTRTRRASRKTPISTVVAIYIEFAESPTQGLVVKTESFEDVGP
jgi:hypothetical protein